MESICSDVRTGSQGEGTGDGVAMGERLRRVLAAAKELEVHGWEFMERKMERTQKRVTAYYLFFKSTGYGAPGWLPQLIDFSSGHDLEDREFEPRVGLCADCSDPGACLGFCVSLSLPLPHSCSLSLSKINIKKINEQINK